MDGADDDGRRARPVVARSEGVAAPGQASSGAGTRLERVTRPIVAHTVRSHVVLNRPENMTLLLINDKLDGVQLSLSEFQCCLNARVDVIQARVDDWERRLAELEASAQLHNVALEGREGFTRDVNEFKAETPTDLGQVKDAQVFLREGAAAFSSPSYSLTPKTSRQVPI